tara:strand:+ start:1339 stop:1701 length:363 start_codon:yes stop_codon:yes gene_type:complete
MVEQKYTKVSNIHYDIDDWFIEQMRDIPMDYAFDIASQMTEQVDELPVKNGWTQYVAGVSHALKEPFFFKLEYLNQEDELCLFLGVEEVDVDTFLDYMNENNILKFNKDEKKYKNREPAD